MSRRKHLSERLQHLTDKFIGKHLCTIPPIVDYSCEGEDTHITWGHELGGAGEAAERRCAAPRDIFQQFAAVEICA
jgi:hypothetical protein